MVKNHTKNGFGIIVGLCIDADRQTTTYTYTDDAITVLAGKRLRLTYIYVTLSAKTRVVCAASKFLKKILSIIYSV